MLHLPCHCGRRESQRDRRMAGVQATIREGYVMQDDRPNWEREVRMRRWMRAQQRPPYYVLRKRRRRRMYAFAVGLLIVLLALFAATR